MPHKRKPINVTLICGLLGCLCFGAGDWLMLPPYLYWCWLLLKKRTGLPWWMTLWFGTILIWNGFHKGGVSHD